MTTLEDKATWRKTKPLPCATETQMLLKCPVGKTKFSLRKNLKNFKSFFFGGYQKLPRSLSFNLCRIANARTQSSDQFYYEFYDLLQSDLSRIKMYDNSNISRSPMEDAACVGNFMCFAKQGSQKGNDEEKVKEKKNKGLSKKELNSQNMNKGAHVLAQKIKALDMMDGGDLEHVLDIEEALHYYSRLKSSVYLDIVDKFFMDIQSQLSVPLQSHCR
ncbi:hypothetical protein RJT34_17084 [Clitoria ternatea]|uniref:Uncharacterized protein n=1 Tax=Clitoria ternatea TaxID=43366 RepID=A0AAN9PCX2_CLITE